MTSVVRVWSPAVLLMAAIFMFSSLPDVPGPPGGISDKTAHVIVYAALGILMVRALADGCWCRVTGRSVASAIVLAVLYGVTDEYHQSFVDGRVADVADVMADAAGACSGGAVVWAWSIVFSTTNQSDQRPHDDV